MLFFQFHATQIRDDHFLAKFSLPANNFPLFLSCPSVFTIFTFHLHFYDQTDPYVWQGRQWGRSRTIVNRNSTISNPGFSFDCLFNWLRTWPWSAIACWIYRTNTNKIRETNFCQKGKMESFMYHLYLPLQLIWANLKNTRQNQPTQTSSCDKKGKKPTIRKIQGETIQRKALAVTKRVKTRQCSRVRTQPMCSDNFSLKYFKDLLQPKTIKKQKTSLSLYTTLLHRRRTSTSGSAKKIKTILFWSRK